MKTIFRLSVGALLILFPLMPGARPQQAPAAVGSSGSGAAVASASPLQKTVEMYLRNLYAWGSDTTVNVAAPKEIGVEGLREVEVEVTAGGNTQTGKVYVSKDGKYMFRGELSDLTKDPLAEVRAQIQTKDAPSLGDPKAPVTLVEFSDFECPVCRLLHDALRGMLPKYPQVRVVFKDFPLEQIHPWARVAALAGRCTYQQDPKAFWRIYDLIYDNQDIISAENAWNKMVEFAGSSGANQDTFKACMASPEAGAAVDASHNNGQQLEVGSTPTVFINGRRIVGADSRSIEQSIKYELDQQRGQSASRKN